MSTRASAAATALALRCPICWEGLKNPSRTPCGHSFCDDCIRTALTHKRECPTCRLPVTHRELLQDTTLAGAVKAPANAPRRQFATTTAGTAEAPSGEWWSCLVCTLRNPLPSARCAACDGIRPIGVAVPHMTSRPALNAANFRYQPRDFKATLGRRKRHRHEEEGDEEEEEKEKFWVIRRENDMELEVGTKLWGKDKNDLWAKAKVIRATKVRGRVRSVRLSFIGYKATLDEDVRVGAGRLRPPPGLACASRCARIAATICGSIGGCDRLR